MNLLKLIETCKSNQNFDDLYHIFSVIKLNAAIEKTISAIPAEKRFQDSAEPEFYGPINEWYNVGRTEGRSFVYYNSILKIRKTSF